MKAKVRKCTTGLTDAVIADVDQLARERGQTRSGMLRSLVLAGLDVLRRSSGPMPKERGDA